MGVLVVPIQAQEGSDDGDDSRNESNENHSGDRDDDDDDDGDGDHNFLRRVWLSGRNEVPAGDPDGSGWAEVSLRPQAGTVCYRIKVRKLDAVTAAHIHVGAVGVNGAIVIDFAILTADKKVWENSIVYKDSISGIASSLLTSIKANPTGYYVNVHSTAFPGGAIRGQLRKAS